ncbi:aminoglycoside phosphotransferase family protein [Patescibacteria group bacterium]|nr:aminoglycoside phosphotransferase family protein [Patescibacteria group bacterium]MBU1891131.1 aminoglycoside phosphotransferase family protein [Patescibacteria group bacterium]
MESKEKKDRLLAAKKTQNDIIKKYNLKLLKIIRNGPRFFVAKCQKGQHTVIFKICLYTDKVDPRTNHGIKREALTLKFFHTHPPELFRQATPKILEHNFAGRTWYIREYLDGEPQNVKDSNFVFTTDFFSKKSADWIANFFHKLHYTSHRFPSKQKAIYAKHTMETNIMLIGWYKVGGYFNFPQAAEKIKYFLFKHESLFDTYQNVLTHYEPYASHFFKYNDDDFYLIDWENVDWGNPAHDISIIWNRAFTRPEWQKFLLKQFMKHISFEKDFKDLFSVELVLQGVSNIDYFNQTRHPAEKPIKKKAIAFYRNNVVKAINGKLDIFKK